MTIRGGTIDGFTVNGVLLDGAFSNVRLLRLTFWRISHNVILTRVPSKRKSEIMIRDCAFRDCGNIGVEGGSTAIFLTTVEGVVLDELIVKECSFTSPFLLTFCSRLKVSAILIEMCQMQKNAFFCISQEYAKV